MCAHACSVAQSCLTLCNPMNCSPPGSSVHGIFQARILEQVAVSYSRDSFWPRDQTHVFCVSCIGKQILYHWATWEAQQHGIGNISRGLEILWLLSLVISHQSNWQYLSWGFFLRWQEIWWQREGVGPRAPKFKWEDMRACFSAGNHCLHPSPNPVCGGGWQGGNGLQKVYFSATYSGNSDFLNL